MDDVGNRLFFYGMLVCGLECFIAAYLGERFHNLGDWFNRSMSRQLLFFVLLAGAWGVVTTGLSIAPLAESTHTALMIVLGVALAVIGIRHLAQRPSR